MAVVALKCPDIEVAVVDISVPRINAWNSDQLPIYEPSLDEVIKQCPLCEATDADVTQVAYAKDILNLVYICECNGLPEVAEFCIQERHWYTRQTPAIDVFKGLLGDKARLCIYDPQVTEDQIQRDLSMNKFEWDHPLHLQPMSPTTVKQESVSWDAYEASKDAHGICISTEWDEFKNLEKPAFVFAGSNIMDFEKLREIGFIVYSIGEPLDAWLKDMPAVA
ncbi:hypothetical protein Bca52824_068335 [Brassica carinata]|uniref:UDP-glucose/GDP-mannose dehydrogenase C-terminal domain-containing protein n=1 Tax=Brassica carinata TaxID=52824 RepID=A0A8X7U1T9_BRACI|nr:hypothetical protein Bca52824_068335 [Brassica carinata]